MSMYSELLKIQKLKNEIITSLKTKLNTTEPLGLKDLSTRISGLSVGNQLIFASEKAGTYEIDLKQTGTYEIVAVGGGGGYTSYSYNSGSKKNTRSYQVGSGGYRKIRVFLEAGKYQATAGKGGESGRFANVHGSASTFSDFLTANPGVKDQSTTKPQYEHASGADSSNSRGECIEAINGIYGSYYDSNGGKPQSWSYGAKSVYSDPDGKSWGGGGQDGYIRVTFIG